MNPSSPPSKISSLIRLLDDRDPYVSDQIGNHLVELGIEAAPFLEIASRGENRVLKTRALEILERIGPKKLTEAFRKLSGTHSEEDIDLEEGMSLLMQFGHPDADPTQVCQTLDDLANGLADRIDPHAASTQVLQQLTDYLFGQQGFHGNQDNYTDPDNSYLDTVLKNKTGLPISLSVLCILIGKRLRLPIVGIGLPYHFIAKYNSASDPILFDPFHKGRILAPEKCSEMVQSFKIKFEDHYLHPVTHREILLRMIQNLVISYQKTGDEDKVTALKEYSAILMERR